MVTKEGKEMTILENMRESISEKVNKTLYLRFPHKVPERDEIKKLSPAIVGVCYPRQKYARFCHIVLRSEESVPEVLEFLNTMKYGDHGHLIAEMPVSLNYAKIKKDNIENGVNGTQKSRKSRKRKLADKSQATNNDKKPAKNENNDRRLWMRKLPITTEEKDLMAGFPGCIWVKLYKNKASRFSCALCKFSSAQQAAAILSDTSKHTINGKNIVVELAKFQQLRGRRKENKAKAKMLKQEQQNESQDGNILRIKNKKVSASDVEMSDITTRNRKFSGFISEVNNPAKEKIMDQDNMETDEEDTDDNVADNSSDGADEMDIKGSDSGQEEDKDDDGNDDSDD